MKQNIITLKLRLSNGRSWAHEFSASSAEEFRDECFEALLSAPQHSPLWLHVLDEHNPHGNRWRDASYGSGSNRAVYLQRPDGRTNQYDHPQWQRYWMTCIRCHFACQELRDFLGGVIGRINPDTHGGIDA